MQSLSGPDSGFEFNTPHFSSGQNLYRHIWRNFLIQRDQGPIIQSILLVKNMAGSVWFTKVISPTLSSVVALLNPPNENLLETLSGGSNAWHKFAWDDVMAAYKNQLSRPLNHQCSSSFSCSSWKGFAMKAKKLQTELDQVKDNVNVWEQSLSNITIQLLQEVQETRNEYERLQATLNQIWESKGFWIEHSKILFNPFLKGWMSVILYRT